MNQRYDIFTHLFGDSLVSPLKDHMAVCNRTAQQLTPFFDAAIDNDRDEVNRLFNEICALEHDADERKRYIRLHLPAGMLLSVSRHDLLEWVRAQDKIANVARDLAGLVRGRAIRIPPFLADDLRVALRQALATVEALERTVEHLDTLVGTGFVPARARVLEAGIDEVDQCERESDRYEQAARQTLFQHEQDLNAIDVMFLYQVIDLIGEVAGRAQAVGNRLTIVTAN